MLPAWRVAEFTHVHKGLAMTNETLSHDTQPHNPGYGIFVPQGAHLNHMGGVSYDISSPLMRLRLAASSTFFGEPTYYQVAGRPEPQLGQEYEPDEHALGMLGGLLPDSWYGLSPAQLMEKAIDEAIEADAEGTLKFAGELRENEHIRITPQIILVRAAHSEFVRATGLIRRYAKDIMQRADEPALQLAYHNSAYGRHTPVPNSLKRAWCTYLSGQSEYSLAKYRHAGRGATLVDVINVCHAKSPAINKVMNGELSLQDSTWESVISKHGNNKEAWQLALDKFLLNPAGHMALLRNLRNLHSHDLLTPRVHEALLDGVSEGKQLPFRYYAAYRELQDVGASTRTLATLEACLKSSLGQIPRFRGKVMSLVDNSGSAQMHMASVMGTMSTATIGNISGLLTGLCADEGWLGVFGDKLEELSVRKGEPIFKQLEEVNELADKVGCRTENGIWLFLDRIIKTKEHWDHIFVYSDMQAGHGGLYGTRPSEYKQFLQPGTGNGIDVAALVARYRQEVNPNVMVYLVQTAGYQDTLIPEFYERTFILSGWGPGMLRFAHQMQAMYQPPLH